MRANKISELLEGKVPVGEAIPDRDA